MTGVLILGATGFIGSEIARRLASEGHRVTGLGRNPERVARKMPCIRWLKADLAEMTRVSAWRTVLEGHSIVVNCAGALQDGLSDDLSKTQEKAMLALYAAAASQGIALVVQISASTEGLGAALPFLATKRKADEALKTSQLPHIILRPSLVIGRNAHGGSALIRALASLPMAIPLIHAEKSVATVAIDDVAEAVAGAVSGKLPAGTDMFLSGDELPFQELVLLHRRWLGLPAARVRTVPHWLGFLVGRLADVAGRLGWRSPLRTTALSIMGGGIEDHSSADRDIWKGAAETLAAGPSGVQDLWFARLYLLKPVMICCVSLFWSMSGIIGLASFEAAKSHFASLPNFAAISLLIATSLADIGLGLAVLVRPWSRLALLGMVGLTFAYLVAATLVEPVLWLDPLGPLVKVLPSLVLSILCLAILDER